MGSAFCVRCSFRWSTDFCSPAKCVNLFFSCDKSSFLRAPVRVSSNVTLLWMLNSATTGMRREYNFARRSSTLKNQNFPCPSEFQCITMNPVLLCENLRHESGGKHRQQSTHFNLRMAPNWVLLNIVRTVDTRWQLFQKQIEASAIALSYDCVVSCSEVGIWIAYFCCEPLVPLNHWLSSMCSSHHPPPRVSRLSNITTCR